MKGNVSANKKQAKPPKGSAYKTNAEKPKL